MPVGSKKDEIIAECLRLVFPNGSSKFLGKAIDIDFGLANSKTEAIDESDESCWVRSSSVKLLGSTQNVQNKIVLDISM